jgi:hypothetical protein
MKNFSVFRNLALSITLPPFDRFDSPSTRQLDVQPFTRRAYTLANWNRCFLFETHFGINNLGPSLIRKKFYLLIGLRSDVH